MATPKLTYFNTKGLGEGIRYLFAYAEVDFVDNRIEKADWPALKEKMPYGNLPVLEIFGFKLNQSAAILRFLGQKYGFVNKDMHKDALLEAVIDNIKDVQIKLKAAQADATPENEKIATEAMAFLLTRLEKVATEGFFYGSKPTWVDFYFTGLFDAINDRIPNILQPYPNLEKLTNNIKNKDSVKKYIKKRPPPSV